MKVGRIDVQVRGKEWTKVRYVLAFKDNGPQADRGMRCARPGVIRRVVGLVGETGRDGECGGGLRSQLAPSVFQQVVRPVQRNATQRNATANTGPYKAPTRSNEGEKAAQSVCYCVRLAIVSLAVAAIRRGSVRPAAAVVISRRRVEARIASH